MAKSKHATKKVMPVLAASQPIKTSQLLLDPRNPRLHGNSAFGSKNEQEILKALWEYGVDDIVESIANTGYHKLEPFFAEENRNGTYTVVEGNRRLAALKLLLNPSLAEKIGAKVPPLKGEVRDQCLEVPVVVDRRQKVWAFIGMKHLNGPRQWDANGKAYYVKTVHEVERHSLADIAAAIGSEPILVRGWYRSLKVLDQAKKWGVYNEEKRFKKRLALSHLYQGLEYPGFQKHLGMEGWKTPDPAPVPETKKKELGEVLLWLFGDKKKDIRPLIESQNPDLKDLDRALINHSGVAELRRGAGLRIAVDASEGEEVIVDRCLRVALEQLERANSKFPVAYSGQPSYRELLSKIQSLVDAILKHQQFEDFKSEKKKK